MKKYNVLWIDDRCTTENAFIMNAELEGIIITPFETSKAGMEAFVKDLFHWDGIVLDAKCWIESSDETADTDAMHESIGKITELKHKREVPYFIYTGHPDLQSDIQFEKSLRGHRFYVKGKDEEILIRDIKTEADGFLVTQIRHEYADVFASYSNHERLLRIFLAIRGGDTKNPIYFNEIRKIIEDEFEVFASNYLFPKGCTEMNARRRFLGSIELKEFVPDYIQWNLFSVVNIAQEGSHRLTIDEAVNSGKAPYLLRSTAMELMSILLWANDFLKSEPCRKLKAEIASGKYDTEGIVEQDEKMNFYCGNFLLPYKVAESMLGAKVRIVKFDENTNGNKDIYHYFAKKIEKI